MTMRAVQRVADPQIAGVLVEEGAALGGRAAQGPAREASVIRAADARLARESSPLVHLAGALEHADDAAQRAARPLALDAHDELGELGREWTRLLPRSLRVLGLERGEAAPLGRRRTSSRWCAPTARRTRRRAVSCVRAAACGSIRGGRRARGAR